MAGGRLCSQTLFPKSSNRPWEPLTYCTLAAWLAIYNSVCDLQEGFLSACPQAGGVLHCPSLDHAATVLVELAEKIKAPQLGKLAAEGCGRPALQRLGWLLDHVKWNEKAGALHAALERQSLNWVSLDPRIPLKGHRNDRWHVVENTDIQPAIER